jgi:osmoprotectant transport system permease protein
MTDFVNFLLANHNRLALLLFQHLQIVLLSMLIAAVFAVPVGFFISRFSWACDIVLGLFSFLYSIPSLAMFTFFLPFTGLGQKTAVLVIAIYVQFILLRSTVSGFRAVDPAIIDVGRGMGLGAWNMFFNVELPLAAPIIVSGIRVSVIVSTAMTAIAATIGAGGIGTLLFEGVRTVYATKIICGVIMLSSLCLIANGALSEAEGWLLKKSRGEIPAKSPRVPNEDFDPLI